MKIKINGKLPEGFKYRNGTVVQTKKTGGAINNTLGPMDRDEANLEAEKGETALTDLTNDGSFELYNIGGKRHTQGGTPLNLPEQSFVYSDTRKMLLTVEELESLGIVSKKKMTPAKASKNFPLNKYIEVLENDTSDKISIKTAEDMINKNKIKLSQLAFIQESKKNFSDGLPLAAYPFLIESGVNPQELEAKIEQQNAQSQAPPPQMSQDQMAMGPQEGGLQQFTGPPQGGPPMGPPMGKYGTELPKAQTGLTQPGKIQKAGQWVWNGAKFIWDATRTYNPLAFNLRDNILFSTGATPKFTDIDFTKTTIGGNKKDIIANMRIGYPGKESVAEKYSIIDEYKDMDAGLMLFNAANNATKQDRYPELITNATIGDPETTVDIWSKFNLRVDEGKGKLKEDPDFVPSSVLADDYNFNTRVQLRGLTLDGENKLKEANSFYDELGKEQNSIFNFDITRGGGTSYWHSPLWRGFKSRFSQKGLTIGDGKPYKEYDQYSKHPLWFIPAAVGTGLYLNALSHDGLDADEEEKKRKAKCLEEATKKGFTTCDEYMESLKNSKISTEINPQKMKQFKDSTGEGIYNYGGTSPMTGQPMVPQMGVPEGYVRDQNPLGLPGQKYGGEPCPVCGKKNCGCKYEMGGSPFERSSLKRFTDGGTTSFAQSAANQGQLSESQLALQNILRYRRDLVAEYEATARYVQENPNVMEDPEKSYEIQAAVQLMEQQLMEIDVQTQSIEQKLLQESTQLDPFADPTMAQQPAAQSPAVAKYGKELPTFQATGPVDKNTLKGQDAWGYQGEDAEGNPIIGHSEPAFETYDPDIASGVDAHQNAFSVMASSDFDPPRKLWLEKYREAAAENNTGNNAWIAGKSDAELFMIFNRMNQYLSTAAAAKHKFAADGAPDDDAAKKYGWGDKAPTAEEVKIFQGMYTALNSAKIHDESGLLDQIVTTPMGEHHVYTSKDIKKMKANNTWTDEKVGDNKMVDANGNPVSFVDGKLGHTTGGQHYRAENKENTSSTTVTKTIPCPDDVRQEKMKECRDQGMRFDQDSCDCAPLTGDWTKPKYPKYETFPQDDLLVATKSAQLAGLEQINPVLQPNLDPQTVMPHYVDPRQSLASLEATAGNAINANPAAATNIMGLFQDQAEKVINKHHATNTKIYNNAQNINIPIMNEAAANASSNFKTFFDEANAAKENFNVAKMELTDNLVNSVNDQMEHADELYVRNLENPNYWYSPQAHNIEYYNARDLDGKISSTNPLDKELADYEYLTAQNPDFAKIYYDKMYGKGKNNVTKTNKVDPTRGEEEEVVTKYGAETRRMKKRQADLNRSKKKLRKWILGYS